MKKTMKNDPIMEQEQESKKEAKEKKQAKKKTNTLQDSEKKENYRFLGLKYYELAIIILFFFLLILILITHSNQNLKRHCQGAICNEDNTICSDYEEDKNGEIKKVWEGNCSTLEK